MLAALRGRAAVALPGGGAAERLRRTLLECLLDKALAQRLDGGFELRSVLAAQLGEAVNKAVADDVQLRMLYKSPGFSFAEVLKSLESVGMVSTAFIGLKRVKHAMVTSSWVEQYTAASTSSTSARRPAAGAAAAPAPAATSAAATSGSSSTEIDIRSYPQLRGGKATFRLQDAVFRLTGTAKHVFFEGRH